MEPSSTPVELGCVVDLSGYLDGIHPPLATSPLVDATSWTADELFWPAFLLQMGMARSAPDAFGVDLADLDAYLDNFEQPDQWPVFAVPIGGGTMHMIVCNLPGDSGIDWVLDADAQEAVRADSGPEYSGSGLPWDLLPREPAHLLMALPAFGEHETADGVRSRVVQALRAVGATAGTEELADDLLKHRACMLL
ncbi:hypothetical protein ABT346_29940 [Micromonospora peucetia]|uniref:hypothetical protein n=1 Tax=Micromonospora peucetia TaxID=47871 RepID=UPI00332A8744